MLATTAANTSTNDTSSAADNSVTAKDTETPTTSTAWKSGICNVPKEDMGILRSAYCKGETYVAEKYHDIKQEVIAKADKQRRSAESRTLQVAWEALQNSNVIAIYSNASGQIMLYGLDKIDQFTAKHLPTVRALTETVVGVGKDLVVAGASQIWQQLPEAIKLIIRQTLVDTGTEIGVMYELLTGNLSEGQKAIADLAIAAAPYKVATPRIVVYLYNYMCDL